MCDDESPGAVLAVGIVCLDIINVCDHYPEEDEAIRALWQAKRRGGNAGNSLSVMSQLGAEAYFLGRLGVGVENDFCLQDLERFSVQTYGCPTSNAPLPTSYITVNQQNSSRTIVHHNPLGELTLQDLQNANLFPGFRWIHFEGRNHEVLQTYFLELKKLVDPHRHSNSRKTTVSLELEKPRVTNYKELAQLVDVVFFSKEFAQHLGHGSAKAMLEASKSFLLTGTIAICAWGESGADAAIVGDEMTIHHSDAFPPPEVVDTIGAGDTFNGAMIVMLCRGLPLRDALTNACKIAGQKCGREGLSIDVSDINLVGVSKSR